MSERGFFYRSLIPQVTNEGHCFVDILSTPSNFPSIKNNILGKDLGLGNNFLVLFNYL